jgi:hypothetical protein
MMGTTKTYLDDFQSILPVALPSIVIIKTNRMAALPIRVLLTPPYVFPLTLSGKKPHQAFNYYHFHL